MAKMIVDLGITWAGYEANGLPAAVTDDESLPLGDTLPDERRPGRVLAYVTASRSDDAAGLVYVGWFEGAHIDAEAKALRFEFFCALEAVHSGRAGDESPSNANRLKGCALFGFVSDDAFKRVLREGMRRTFRLSEGVVGALPGYAVETGRTEDDIVEEALREYFGKRDWCLDE